MRSFVSTLLAAFMVVLGLCSVAEKAHAQGTSVVVLGLTSLEGDDTFATNLSGALRRAATLVRGWSVSDRDVPLSQLELATGCDASELSCVQQIAQTVGAQRLVYGTIQRSAESGGRFDFQIQIHLYDVATGAVLSTVEERLPSSRTDIDDLREPARQYISRLSEVAGPVAGGSALPPEGTTLESQQQGIELEQHAAPPPAESGGGSDIGRLNWPAFALLAVAVGGAVGWTLAGLDAQSANSTLQGYADEAARNETGIGLGRCEDAQIAAYIAGSHTTSEADIRGACGSNADILQFVFIGVTAAAGIGGVALLAANGIESAPAQGTGTASLRLQPSVRRDGGYLGVQLSF